MRKNDFSRGKSDSPLREDSTRMSKLTLTGLALPLFLLFASPPASAPKAFGAMKETTEDQAQGGTLQKMIIENGSVTMDLDVTQFNGIGSMLGTPTTLQ